jgi:hypothetical protein
MPICSFGWIKSCIYKYMEHSIKLGLTDRHVWVRTPFLTRCTRYNIMWWSLSVTCDWSGNKGKYFTLNSLSFHFSPFENENYHRFIISLQANNLTSLSPYATDLTSDMYAHRGKKVQLLVFWDRSRNERHLINYRHCLRGKLICFIMQLKWYSTTTFPNIVEKNRTPKKIS